MVKLTPELIAQSHQYINPVRDRELDLRGEFIFYLNNIYDSLNIHAMWIYVGYLHNNFDWNFHLTFELKLCYLSDKAPHLAYWWRF